MKFKLIKPELILLTVVCIFAFIVCMVLAWCTPSKNDINNISSSYISETDIEECQPDVVSESSCIENNTLSKEEIISSQESVSSSSQAASEAVHYSPPITSTNSNVWCGKPTYSDTDVPAIVLEARSHLGKNYVEFCSWYGVNTAWCAIFTSYCATKTNTAITSAAWVPNIAAEFKANNKFKYRNEYTPKPGDIIFYDYSLEGNGEDHVGIVEWVEGNIVYSIEGNWSSNNASFTASSVQRTYHKLSYSAIYGYGII